MPTSRKHIPSYKLKHSGENVDFAIRTVEQVVKIFGNQTDIPHRHNYYTVLWSQNNSGKHIIDYKEYEMLTNDIFFVTPGQVHQVLHKNAPRGIVILFTCQFMEKNYINHNFINNLNLFSEIEDSPPIRIDQKSGKKLQLITNQMIETFNEDGEYRFDTIGAYLKLFLIECNKFAPGLKSDNTQTIQSSKSIIRKFKEILEQNFFITHKVIDYAEKLNITPDYLNSVIKSSIGKTAKELIQQRILLEAKRYGLHSNLSTKEISYELGYDEPSNFSRFFKKHEGISFVEFKKALEEQK